MNILNSKERVLLNFVDTALYLGFEHSRNAEHRTHDGRNCFCPVSDLSMRRTIRILERIYDIFSSSLKNHKMFTQLFNLALLIGDYLSLCGPKIRQKIYCNSWWFRHFFFGSENKPDGIFIYVTSYTGNQVKNIEIIYIFFAVSFPYLDPNEQFLQSCMFFLQGFLCAHSFSSARVGGGSPIGKKTASERHGACDQGTDQRFVSGDPTPQPFKGAVWCVGDVEGDPGKRQQRQQEAERYKGELYSRVHAHTLHAACGTSFRQAPMVAA